MSDRAAPDHTWRRNLRVLAAGQLVTMTGLTIMVPFLPLYLEELGVADRRANALWSGAALAAPAIALMIAAPLWGRLGDRLGRKWMVVRALVGLGGSMLLMGVIQTPLALVLCRIVQGACGGVVDAAAAFATSDAPPKARGRALGGFQRAIAAGCLAGPLIGGAVIETWGLRPPLVIIGLLTGACALLTALLVRERPAARAPEARTASLRRLTAELLSRRDLRALLLAGVCVQAGIYGTVTVFPIYVRDLLGGGAHTGTWVGMLQATAWAASALAAPYWGRRNDRASIQSSFALAAVGCALALSLQALPDTPAALVPLRALQGACVAALAQSIYLYVSRQSAAAHRGAHVGIANSFLTMGQIAGALVGSLLAGFLAAPWVFVLTSVFFWTGAALAWSTEPLPVKEGVSLS